MTDKDNLTTEKNKPKKVDAFDKNSMTVGAFLSNSKKVKQFSSLNEVSFEKKYLDAFKKDPKEYPYNQSLSDWEELFQKWVGVDFKKLKV